MTIRYLSLAEMVGAARGRPDADRMRFWLQFIDDFAASSPADRRRMLAESPESTGDTRWDAFLGGLAEHLAFHHGLDVPSWTVEPHRFLRTFWFVSDLPSGQAAALAESPAAFRRRGVFVTEDLFARA